MNMLATQMVPSDTDLGTKVSGVPEVSTHLRMSGRDKVPLNGGNIVARCELSVDDIKIWPSLNIL
jgi:hypothetical protein